MPQPPSISGTARAACSPPLATPRNSRGSRSASPMTVDACATWARTRGRWRRSWIGSGSSWNSSARCSSWPSTESDMSPRLAHPLERVAEWDGALALKLNRAGSGPWARMLFQAASRLGDGVLWYALMLALLLRFGADAAPAVLHMVLAGLACTALYKWVKGRTLRPRPYGTHPGIRLLAAPLDRFSFPSGHALHAVAFTLVAVTYYPWLAWLAVPFTVLVAASRVMLGLHYPSDVLAGVALGAAVAGASVLLAPL